MVDILGFFDGVPFLLGIIVLILLFGLQTPVLTFPSYVLSFYGGLIYGPILGSIINYLGIFTAVSFGYYLGSIGKGDKLSNSSPMIKLDAWLNEKGMFALLFLRLVPIIPYNIVSIGSGVVKFDKSSYFMINAFAIIPYAILFAILGNALGVSLIERLDFKLDIRLLIPTIAIIFVIVFVYFGFLRSQIPTDPTLE